MSSQLLEQPHLALDCFRSLMDRYEKFVAQTGKKVRRAPPAETIALFQNADNALKERLFKRLETEVAIFEDMLEAREALDNSSRHLWRFLLKSKLTPCSDVFDKVSKTDTIQVYSSDHRLIFASLNFFDHVSFTLEQVLGETWQTAVKRDMAIVEDLYVQIMHVFSGKIRHTLKVTTPAHLVEEIGTECLIKSKLRVKWASPVFSGDIIPCIISVVEVVNI
jgi:hypothetical protein